MSTIDLIIMGLLKKHPMSAYDLAQYIEINGMINWVKISSAAVYHNTRSLAQKGYLSGESVKQSEMPEKKVYSITPKGDDYFLHLMEHFSKNPGKVYADYNVFVANIEHLKKSDGLLMLENLRTQIMGYHTILKPFMLNLESYPIGKKAILKQFTMISNTLSLWIDEIIEEYKNTK